MYTRISKCRICGNGHLIPVLNLGRQCLTGTFPKADCGLVSRAPIQLVKCHPYSKSNLDNCCHLLQLEHTVSLDKMYGFNYGYRSSLNKKMRDHLNDIAIEVGNYIKIKKDDLVIDIGSNDGTLLTLFGDKYPSLNLIGIDPAGEKFRKYYPLEIHLISEFFNKEVVKNRIREGKAKVITSIAMFYDLEDPCKFAKDIYSLLDDNGIWVMEQGYMPLMIKEGLYDAVCHEHLEYYGLKQIKYIADQVGFKIIDVKFNDVNGASFFVVLTKKTNQKLQPINSDVINFTLLNEDLLITMPPYVDFQINTFVHKQEINNLLGRLKKEGEIIYGYGASTKGNVFLQFCGIDCRYLDYIVEINEDKNNCYTPGTNIPIKMKRDISIEPNYYLVLPWHFKENILEKEKVFLSNGGKFIFAFPEIKIIGEEDL